MRLNRSVWRELVLPILALCLLVLAAMGLGMRSERLQCEDFQRQGVRAVLVHGLLEARCVVLERTLTK